MKVFVTGVGGQLGYDVMKELEKRGYESYGSDLQENSIFSNYIKLDLTDENEVTRIINEIKPDAVIHCAAWTAVDRAEDNKELVYKINALAPKYIASACNKIGAKMVQISTDYVFDGKGTTPFEVDTPKGAISTYGKTKSDGEDFVMQEMSKYFIVRTTGVFGLNGNNFIKTMLKLANSGKTELNVVDDQIVSVTYTKDLAILLVDMIETEKYGVYHAANGGYFSWCEFARKIFSLTQKNVIVHAVTTEEYKKMVPNQTDRPKNSRLSLKSLDEAGFKRLPDYLDSLKRYLDELDSF